jgi:hypothetical protein
MGKVDAEVPRSAKEDKDMRMFVITTLIFAVAIIIKHFWFN